MIAISRFGTTIPKHLERQIAVTFITALVLTRLEPVLDLVSFLGELCHEIVRFPTLEHAFETLTHLRINGGDRILTEIEPVEADHLNAKAFENLLPFKIIGIEVRAPRHLIDMPCRHVF